MIRKVKKISHQKSQREQREKQAASYYYDRPDNFLQVSSSNEGLF